MLRGYILESNNGWKVTKAKKPKNVATTDSQQGMQEAQEQTPRTAATAPQAQAGEQTQEEAESQEQAQDTQNGSNATQPTYKTGDKVTVAGAELTLGEYTTPSTEKAKEHTMHPYDFDAAAGVAVNLAKERGYPHLLYDEYQTWYVTPIEKNGNVYNDARDANGKWFYVTPDGKSFALSPSPQEVREQKRERERKEKEQRVRAEREKSLGREALFEKVKKYVDGKSSYGYISPESLKIDIGTLENDATQPVIRVYDGLTQIVETKEDMDAVREAFDAAGKPFPEINTRVPEHWEKPKPSSLHALVPITFADGTVGGFSPSLAVFTEKPNFTHNKKETAALAETMSCTGKRSENAVSFTTSNGNEYEFSPQKFAQEISPEAVLSQELNGVRQVVMYTHDGSIGVSVPENNIAWFQWRTKGKARYFINGSSNGYSGILVMDGNTPMGVFMPFKKSMPSRLQFNALLHGKAAMAAENGGSTGTTDSQQRTQEQAWKKYTAPYKLGDKLNIAGIEARIYEQLPRVTLENLWRYDAENPSNSDLLGVRAEALRQAQKTKKARLIYSSNEGWAIVDPQTVTQNELLADKNVEWEIIKPSGLSYVLLPEYDTRDDAPLMSLGNTDSGTSQNQDTPSMAAVRQQYQGTQQWMKAPNGKPTKLNERQWLQVRTPEFKAWFGDWEVANAYNFATKGEPVAALTGSEFQKDGVPLTDKVTDFYQKHHNGQVENRELGTVKLDKEGVKDSLGHGVGRLKAAAYAAVPNIIRDGVIFNREQNWKGRGYDTAVIVAPITINGQRYVGEVVVKQGKDRQGFYLHEIEITTRLENAFKTATGSAPQASRLILGSKLHAVKDCSKVVDENGEPLATEVNRFERGEESPLTSIAFGQFVPPVRRGGTGRSLTAQVVEDITNKLSGRAKNAAPVRVVQSINELPQL